VEPGKRGRRRGEPQLYNEATTCRSFCFPPALLQALTRDANTRNLHGDTKYWRDARVVVDILAKHYGIDVSPDTGS